MKATISSARSGQGLVEYILILAIIIGVVYGLFESVFKPRVEQMQNDLKQNTIAVLRQKPLGIPLVWFGFNSPTFDDAEAQLGGPLGNGANGDGDTDDADTEGAGNVGGVRNGVGGRGGRDVNLPDEGSSGSGRLGPGSGGARGSGDSGDSSDEAGTSGGRDRRDRQRGAEPDAGGVDDNDSFRGDEPSAEATTEEKKPGEGKSDPPGRVKRQDDFEESQTGHCGRVNIFTILKLVAVLAILFLGAAIVVTGRGQKGND